ncbi:hypothetical protein MOO44_08510 [Nicoliella spurrieriana]|uniref:DUF2357 domain-containing protein n=1 Tax=Nicoliella spurrieriana TaxID=2925830 RepID=A0A976RSC5_9LACO|nr:hypothetical protein [Nicoliella spurrieriana]UQS86891.1 hypothetical protein MOO44_08510 [Nicoliella spurrieriana]
MQTRVVLIRGRSGKEQLELTQAGTACYQIKENTYCSLAITVGANERVYLEGLSELKRVPLNSLARDERGRQYLASDCTVSLYDTKINKDVYIPGYYKLVVCADETRYQCWLKFNNKFFGTGENADQEYNQMVFDIDAAFKKLSQVATNKRARVASILLIDELMRFLKAHLEAFTGVVANLKQHPQNQLKRGHHWSPALTGRLDRRSLNRMAQKPSDGYYVQSNQVNFNTQANQNLKATLRRLNFILNPLVNANNDEIITPYVDLINQLLTHSWLKRVTDRPLRRQAHQIDYRYRFMTQFLTGVEDCLRKQHSIAAQSNQFGIARRSSYDLYEYWGFISVIVAFHQLGFSDVPLWSLAEQLMANNQPIDGLPKMTQVKMTKPVELGTLKLTVMAVITYNDEMDHVDNGRSKLWIDSNHYKPDLRVDFFDHDADDTLIGSFIMDTKYREIKYFINDRNKDTMQQLLDYYYKVNSSDMFKSAHYVENIPRELLRVVSKVGIINPVSSDAHLRRWGLESVFAVPSDKRQINDFIDAQITAILNLVTILHC